MSDYGIKVSRQGTDIIAAANKDLIITSGRNCLKVDSPVAVTVVTDGFGNATKTITHTLGFVPVLIVIINISGSFYFLPCEDLGYNFFAYFTVSSTSFTVNISAFSLTNTSITFYYFLSETESAS